MMHIYQDLFQCQLFVVDGHLACKRERYWLNFSRYSLLLVSLKDRPDVTDHCSKFCRSLWSRVASSSHLMVGYNFVSSANIAIWELFAESGRSFTYERNRAGPRIDPCGTPDYIGSVSKVAPSTVTRWRRSVKYD